ncbi:MAG: protein kinase [Pirellulaceae bacterium]
MSQEKTIFLNAIEFETYAQQIAYVQEACRDQAELLCAMIDLLKQHQQHAGVLDRPLVRAEPDTALETQWQHAFAASEQVDQVGTLVGPYRLMEQIGEGGFGLVFVAEQQEPVRRKVALKIIKPGMETRDVIARFEAERQALALMDHANIARVFDAGVTQSGRPFFVMELVRGIPLNEFCDQHQLDTLRRLELFITICRAVQHAHQKGVIHRDLKPSNVLVTLQDGQPLAKVIDFGVAKAVGQTLTDKTIYTRFTSMIGTPAYMSPEQAAMSAGDVDTRTDIYALGVLLYELLVGTTPFESKRLANADFDEIRHIIREEEPPRPSARLSTLAGSLQSTVSASRQLEPAQLNSMLRGDLDWIVMKAIDKDRNRRYDTAGDLADDITRYLTQQPIEARPPTAAYRLRKFARRNRVSLVTGSLVTLALIVGLGVSVWQARVAIQERDEKVIAWQEAVKARNEADAARIEVERFADRLKQANLLLGAGRAHADSGDWAAAHADYSKAIRIQPHYYHVWVERGSMYARLGLWDRAAADFSRAIELGAPIDGIEWSGVPQLMWYTQKTDAYQQLCCAMQLTDREHSFWALHQIRARLCGDFPATTFSELKAECEHYVSFDAHANRSRFGRNNHLRGFQVYILAWCHYRCDEFAQAARQLESIPSFDQHWDAIEIIQPLLASSYFRTSQPDLAQQALANAEHSLQRWLQHSTSSPENITTTPVLWFDWLEFLLHYRSASLQIHGTLPVSFQELQEREHGVLTLIQSKSRSN